MNRSLTYKKEVNGENVTLKSSDVLDDLYVKTVMFTNLIQDHFNSTDELRALKITTAAHLKAYYGKLTEKHAINHFFKNYPLLVNMVRGMVEEEVDKGIVGEV